MNNFSIIESVPYRKLLSGMTLDGTLHIWDRLKPLLKEHGTVDIGIAYTIGMMQGIHNERQRRKGGVV